MTITMTMIPDEQAAFLQLLDAALRHAGTGALDVAAHFKAKLVAAQREAGGVSGSAAPTGAAGK